MDVEAIKSASEKLLTDLGLEAKGDILALQSFAKRTAESPVNLDYEERKRKLIDELKKGRNQGKKQKVSETKIEVKIKSRKISLGWMHWNADNIPPKYASVRNNNGGGSRKIDIPIDSSKTYIIEEAKALFFPGGISPKGRAEDMQFDLANFKGDPIACPMNEEESFTLQSYIEKHKLTQVRLYLTSKNCDSIASESCTSNKEDEEDEEELMKPMIDLTSSGSDEPDIRPSLMGTSEERQKLKKEQDEQFQRSLEEDKRKQKKKEELQLEEAKETARLESLRLTRSLRVPPEPDKETPRVRVAVNHITNGRLVRYFKQNEKMVAVYDWVGSQAVFPEHFNLSCPGQTLKPSDEVTNCTLYMGVADEPIAMSDDSDICFKGFDFGKDCYDLGDMTIDSLFQDLDSSASGVSNDLHLEEHIESKDVEPNDDFIKLDNKRKEARDGMTNTVFLDVKKEHIVRDVMAFYKDNSVTTKKVIADIEGEEAAGDGVLREVYSMFWEELLSKQSDGYSEFVIPVSPNLSEGDYVILGRILSHQFIQCGTFPLRIAQASIQHMLSGHVSDECKVKSLLRLLPLTERECLSRALSGEGMFPKEEMIDIFEDFNIRQLPSPENIKTLVLQAATNEFITKPYLGLTKMREGMGPFWNGVGESEVASLYELCVPTIPRLIKSLDMVPTDSKEQQIFRWLERYVRGASDDILIKFLRFCTSTDVLLPTDSICVCLESMAPEAMRPKAFTCFKKLIIPKNYQSFAQLRNNMDFYLRNCQKWDLND